MERARKQLTYANVVSTIALFVALGGATAFAVQQLPEKSVGERQLRPGAVTASKLRKNAVTAPKIKALAVKSGKLANGAVQVNKLATGAVSGEKLAGGAVTGAKIANETVTGDKIVESTLGEVPSANKASSATSATSANPVLFAKVEADGSVDTAASKGISGANVSEPQSGTYCIGVPGFSPKGAQVTPEQDVNGGGVTAEIRVGGPKCPVPQVEVLTWEGKASIQAAFFVVLYN